MAQVMGTMLLGGGGIVPKLQLSRLQAQAEREQAEFKARQLETNAKRIDQEAADVIKRGERAATDLKIDARRVIGSQRVALAAQGIDISDIDSSATEIQADTARMAELDAMTIRNNAWRQSFGMKTQASDLRSGAAITRLGGEFEAQMTETAGALEAMDQAISFGMKAATAGGG